MPSRCAGYCADHRWQLDLPEDEVQVPEIHAPFTRCWRTCSTNARMHTPAGTSHRTALSVDHPATSCITVSDDGPGIPPAFAADLRPLRARGYGVRVG